MTPTELFHNPMTPEQVTVAKENTRKRRLNTPDFIPGIAFEIKPARLPVPVQELPVPAQEISAHHTTLNIIALTAEEKAAKFINNSLDHLVFANNTPTQQSYEDKYKQHAIAALVARTNAYNSDQYDPARDMNSSRSEAALPILMSATQGFLSSALRSPVGNVVSLTMDSAKGEFTTEISRIATSGAVSGAAAYVANEILIGAIDNCADAGNVPKIKPVNVDDLLPKPCRFVLKVERQTKSYVKLNDKDYENLCAKHDDFKANVLNWQKALTGKGNLPVWIQPVLTTATNVIRRAISAERIFFNTTTLYFSSAFASGLAGSVAKGGLSFAQVTPTLCRTEVDDFVGGKRKVNLFKVTSPDPGKSSPVLSDLPMGVYRTGVEFAVLTAHTLDYKRPRYEILNQAADIARYVACNIFSSFAATSMGKLVNTDIREVYPGNNEKAFNSKASLFQQGVQSGSNESTWKALQEYTKPGAYSVTKSLKARRQKLS